jgi:hypothetical protein
MKSRKLLALAPLVLAGCSVASASSSPVEKHVEHSTPLCDANGRPLPGNVRGKVGAFPCFAGEKPR